MKPPVRILPAGDQGLVIELGDVIDPEVNARVRWLARVIATRLRREILEVVPTYRSLLVLHDPRRGDGARLARRVEQIVAGLPEGAPPDAPGRTVYLPACYGGDFGPDLERVASHNGLGPDDVVRIHAAGTYLVYMLGFTPGFPYFGGMSARIATPRLETPRQRVGRGSIGIGGHQTGIYPVESPGGWLLIGRTPARLFDPRSDAPFLLAPGDQVRFEPITPQRYEEIAAEVEAGGYAPRIESPSARASVSKADRGEARVERGRRAPRTPRRRRR